MATSDLAGRTLRICQSCSIHRGDRLARLEQRLEELRLHFLQNWRERQRSLFAC
jgi:hypothetical protein